MLVGSELRETFPQKTKRNQFYGYELDNMRYWIYTRPANSDAIRQARTALFDRMRYREDFEGCAQMVIDLGGEIISPIPGVPKHSPTYSHRKTH